MKTEKQCRDLIERIEMLHNRFTALLDRASRSEIGGLLVSPSQGSTLDAMQDDLHATYVALNWVIDHPDIDKPCDDDRYLTLEEYLFKSSQFLDTLNESNPVKNVRSNQR